MRETRSQIQFDCFLGQQSYGPSPPTLRRFRVGQGNQTGLESPIESNLAPRLFRLFPLQGSNQPIFNETLLQVFDGARRNAQSLSKSATVQAGVLHHTGVKRVRKGTVSHWFAPFSKSRVPDVLALLMSPGISVSWQIPPPRNLPYYNALYEYYNVTWY